MRLFFIPLSAMFIFLSGTALGNEGTEAEYLACPKDSIKPTPFVLQFLINSKELNEQNLHKLDIAGATLKTSLREDNPQVSTSAEFMLKNAHGAVEITSNIDLTEKYYSLSEKQIQSLKEYAQSAQEFQKDAYTMCSYTGIFRLDEKNRSGESTITSTCTTTMDYAMLMSLLFSKPHAAHNDL